MENEPAPAPPRPSKAARNKRVELLATTTNAIGLATLGFGALAPLLGTVQTGFGVQSVASGVISVALFRVSWIVLGRLED